MERTTANEIRDLHFKIKEAILKMAKPPLGINYTQGGILLYLYKHENDRVYQKDLEDFLHIRKSSISEHLNSLEEKGLIQRKEEENDHRKKYLKLSDSARKSIQSFIKSEEIISEKLTKNIKEEELAVFFSVIDKMKGNMEL